MAHQVVCSPERERKGRVDRKEGGAGQAVALRRATKDTGHYGRVVQRGPVRIGCTGDGWRQLPLGPGMSVVPTVKVRD